MNCLRCGQKLEKDGTFCDKCVTTMEHFPVDPGTAVILPKKKPVVPAAHPVRSRTLEETVRQQKGTIRLLSIALAVLVLLVALETAILFLHTTDHEDTTPIGQNYNAETTNDK